MGLVRFFSLNARTSARRGAWWFVACAQLGLLALVALGRVDGVALVLLYVVLGLVLAKLMSVSVRRLHDRGRPGKAGILPMTGVLALVATALLHWLAYGADSLFWGALVLAAAAAVLLTMLPGDRGSNAYGPPPPRATDEAHRLTGLAVAAAIVTVSAGFGMAVTRWQADRARQAEERTRIDPAAIGVPAQMAPTAPMSNENAALFGRIDDLLRNETR